MIRANTPRLPRLAIARLPLCGTCGNDARLASLSPEGRADCSERYDRNDEPVLRSAMERSAMDDAAHEVKLQHLPNAQAVVSGSTRRAALSSARQYARLRARHTWPWDDAWNG